MARHGTLRGCGPTGSGPGVPPRATADRLVVASCGRLLWSPPRMRTPSKTVWLRPDDPPGYWRERCPWSPNGCATGPRRASTAAIPSRGKEQLARCARVFATRGAEGMGGIRRGTDGLCRTTAPRNRGESATRAVRPRRDGAARGVKGSLGQVLIMCHRSPDRAGLAGTAAQISQAVLRSGVHRPG